jgi:hypothetical protein
MEIILAKTCRSLTGSLGRIYGYSITRRDGKFVSIRNPKGPRIQDGHLRFIFACADMAQYNYFIGDIDVEGKELLEAAREAHVEMETILPDVQYNAHDIRRIKTYYSL